MSVVAARIRRLDLLLREPYTIAYDTYDRTTNFLFRIEDADGCFGVGCAAPAADVTGETAETCAQVLERAGEALAAGSPDGDLDGATVAAAPAAAAAVDAALLDLRARRLEAPVGALLGARADSVATSITLGIMATGEMIERAERYAAGGFVALKVKGGHSVDDDIERLLALRDRLGPGVELRFDANQGYGVAEALELASATCEADVSVMEQPTPADAPEALGEVRAGLEALRARGRHAPLLMADESATDLATTAGLLLAGHVEALNIKLMKVGGIAPAQALDRLAAAVGVATMVSCMDEAALAIAAGLQFALSSPNVRWVDLDGHLDLVDDPTAASVALRGGRLFPARGPGFGSPDVG